MTNKKKGAWSEIHEELTVDRSDFYCCLVYIGLFSVFMLIGFLSKDTFLMISSFVLQSLVIIIGVVITSEIKVNKKKIKRYYIEGKIIAEEKEPEWIE